MWGVTSLSSFAPGTMRSAAPRTGGAGGAGGSHGRAAIEVMPTNLAFAVAGVPGRFPLLHIRF